MVAGELLVINGIKYIVSKFENKHALKDFIKTYLQNYHDKHKQIKTFLHGGKNLSFKDIYYPLVIKSSHSSERKIKNATDLYLPNAHNHITIIGYAGSGKSTFAKNMFMEVIEKKKGKPFLIELRQLKDHRSIDDYINKMIVKSEETYNSLTKRFQKGGWVFFLDGFDELQKENKSMILSTFIDSYPKNKFILTSRPSSNAEKLERFENYELLSLTDENVIEFTKKQLRFIDESEYIGENLLRSLRVGLENDTIKAFLTNPLLLSIYILTFQKSPDIPQSKNLFYRRVLDALFYQHDAKTKPGFSREKNCDLSQDNLERMLKKFSYRTYTENVYTWRYQELNSALNEVKELLSLDFQPPSLIEDMTTAYALWTEDDGEYAFSHRSFQEFFTCHYIKENSGKEKIYKSLLLQLDNKKSRREINNLLYLLEEIDEESFIKNFKLPLFKKTNEFLQENTAGFLKKYTKYLYSSGTPNSILAKYKPCIDILDNINWLSKGSKYEFQNFIIGTEIAIGARMGIGIEMRIRMGIIEIGVGFEEGIMGIGIGIGIVIGIVEEREMTKEGVKIGAKEVIKEIIKRAGEDIMQKNADKKFDKKVTSQLNRNIYDIACNKATNAKKLMDTSINDSICYLSFLSVITDDLEYIEDYPFIKGHRLTNLLKIPTQFEDSSTLLNNFIEKNKDKFISIDNLPKEILSDIEKKIEPNYKEYKKFIADEITKLQAKLDMYDANNKDDLALLEL